MTVPTTQNSDTEAPLAAPTEPESAPAPTIVDSPQLAQAGTTEEVGDDDDDLTIIGLDHDPENGNNDQQAAALAWIEQNGPEMEERRRNVLLRELQRVQRASFIHFVLLCLIPTSLLFIVVATVLGEDESCESDATSCAKEARTFINAFTTRCICEAIDVVDGQA